LHHLYYSMIRQPLRYTLFPYTTLFRSAIIEDVDGNRYLDFAIGSGSMSLGGANPELVKVVKERVEELAHASYPSMNEVVIEFAEDRKSTRLNSSHVSISYAVFCLKKKS